ncbi:MAG: MotA/TolQ/ExbB proton channel family protein, partial [Candidatus Nealsonbacteria bacterium]|nr:MotA/TolQ/ExbB proton channel family protein [Candidatus Nealsonbacteria bacterium]
STMDQNPYESTQTTGASRRTRSTRWLVWAGVACFVIAAICVAVTVVGMIYCFSVIAESSSTPRPEDLARGISTAMLPIFAAIPFAVLGVILLVAGLVIRRPVS